jgi:hypothetical protein
MWMPFGAEIETIAACERTVNSKEGALHNQFCRLWFYNSDGKPAKLSADKKTRAKSNTLYPSCREPFVGRKMGSDGIDLEFTNSSSTLFVERARVYKLAGASLLAGVKTCHAI